MFGTLPDVARRSRRLPEWAVLVAPLVVPDVAIGLSFGVLAGQAGLGVAAGAIMSATTFAGSAQFAAVSLLAADAGVMVAVAAAASLNVRYLPMGVAAAPWFSGSVSRRMFEAQMIIDESWVMAQRSDGSFDKALMTRIGLSFLVLWVAFTALGAHLGSRIDNLDRFGLDAMVPGVFLALLVPRLRRTGERRIAFVAGFLALLTMPFVPQGVPILLSLLAVLARGRR